MVIDDCLIMSDDVKLSIIKVVVFTDFKAKL